MRRIGFTGTQLGMTDEQRNTLHHLLPTQPYELHHGDCVGADADAHAIAQFWGCARIIGHPPLVSSKRAHCTFDEKRTPKRYLERNVDIVDETDELIACPGTRNEIVRSGTWATIRYATRLERPVTIIWPDGTTEVRNAETA